MNQIWINESKRLNLTFHTFLFSKFYTLSFTYTHPISIFTYFNSLETDISRQPKTTPKIFKIMNVPYKIKFSFPL